MRTVPAQDEDDFGIALGLDFLVDKIQRREGEREPKLYIAY